MPYYLATVFERIYLQPSGDVGLTGVALEEPFFNEALWQGRGHAALRQAARVQDRGQQVHGTRLHPEHGRCRRLVDSAGEQMVEGIATGRGLPRNASVS